MPCSDVRPARIPMLTLVALVLSICANAAEDISPSTRATTAEMAAQIETISGRANATVAYRNVAVFDATPGAGLVRNMTVIVIGDRIAAITASAADAVLINNDVEIVDASGWSRTIRFHAVTTGHPRKPSIHALLPMH